MEGEGAEDTQEKQRRQHIGECADVEGAAPVHARDRCDCIQVWTADEGSLLVVADADHRRACASLS
jgi:hypothetical protein